MNAAGSLQVQVVDADPRARVVRLAGVEIHIPNGEFPSVGAICSLDVVVTDEGQWRGVVTSLFAATPERIERDAGAPRSPAAAIAARIVEAACSAPAPANPPQSPAQASAPAPGAAQAPARAPAPDNTAGGSRFARFSSKAGAGAQQQERPAFNPGAQAPKF